MKNKNFGKIYFIVGICALALAVLDRLVKWVVAANLKTPLELFPYFSLRYEENTGIAWSIPIPFQVLIPLSLILLVLIPFFIIKQLDLRQPLAQFSLVLILAGGLGNVFDRLYYGFVVDFISIGAWPVFNLADAFLTTGIFLILVFYAKIKRT